MASWGTGYDDRTQATGSACELESFAREGRQMRLSPLIQISGSVRSIDLDRNHPGGRVPLANA